MNFKSNEVTQPAALKKSCRKRKDIRKSTNLRELYEKSKQEKDLFTQIKTIESALEELKRVSHVIEEYETSQYNSGESIESEDELGEYMIAKIRDVLKRLENHLNYLSDEIEQILAHLIGTQEQIELKRIIIMTYDVLTGFTKQRAISKQIRSILSNKLQPSFNALVDLQKCIEIKIHEDVLNFNQLLGYYYQKEGRYTNIFHLKNSSNRYDGDKLLQYLIQKECAYDRIIQNNGRTGEYKPIFGDNHTRKSAPKRWGKWLQAYRKQTEKETVQVRFFYLSDLLFVLFFIGSLIYVSTFFNIFEELNQFYVQLKDSI